ncbi:MAG: T9SS type A sorting domain-containing protein [Bacteroidota bacterium]
MKPFLITLIYLVLFSPARAQLLNFELTNAVVLDTGSVQQFQFNVVVSSDQPGTFHSRGLIYLTYNPEAFGTNIHHFDRVIVEDLMLANDQEYAVLRVTDNNDSTLAITYEGIILDQQPNNSILEEVPEIPTGLFRVTIDIIDDQATLGVCFNKFKMYGQFFNLVAPEQEVVYPFPEVYGECLNNWDGITSVSDPVEAAFNIFPNPSSGWFEVIFEQTREQHITLTLSDLSGRTIMKVNKNLSSGRLIVDARSVPAGLYILTLNEEGEMTSSRKLVIVN